MKNPQQDSIPSPKSYPIVKNLMSLDVESPVQSMMALAKAHGGIFRLELPTSSIVLVSDPALVDELCDESRFDKKVHNPLEKIRDLAKDGLFTAYTQEPNWEKAHRILVPAFGPSSIKNMFEQMYDIAEQLCLKWERLGQETHIDVPDNMTRLTLDTIALCAFDYRFNSFYQNEMHPYVDAMVNALHEAGMYARRLPLQNKLMFLTRRNYEQEIEYMHQVSAEIIKNRRQLPASEYPNDLLSLMLQGKDPLTGEGLSDQNIIYQMATFLIAGHETTSGLLSFAIYELLKNPETLRKAQAEVDAVLGKERIAFKHLNQLKYLDQVLKEALRIWPTAPAFGLTPYENTVIGGKYPVKKGETVLVLLPSLHRRPEIWGQNVEAFDPERFAPERIAQVPVHAYKPFGNGQRACIGRPFALQEAVLVLAMVLQRFDLQFADPNYTLKVKETLTLKPDNLYIRVKKREGQAFSTHNSVISSSTPALSASKGLENLGKMGTGKPIWILYGSNSGSAQDFARRIAADAAAKGYQPELASLDSYVEKLPKEGPLVVVTASYEGQPTDNARQFVPWLDSLPENSLSSLNYTVFGCGNTDWVRTYQAIPKKLDAQFQHLGAKPFLARGEADAKNDFFGDFDRWYAQFWPSLASVLGEEAPSEAQNTNSQYQIEVLDNPRPQILRETSLQLGKILENRELVNMQAPNARSKRHIQIELPEGMHYETGDYLAVLPSNPKELVERALLRFNFELDAQVIVHAANKDWASLPTDYPVSVAELLSHYVELNAPATQKQVAMLAEATACPPEKKRLAAYAEKDLYTQEILNKRRSVLDLLQLFPACELPFQVFLEMLPAMKPRRYSISSSNLANPKQCSLTVAVLDAPALSGLGRYKGIASTYLAGLEPGAMLALSTKPSQADFHPPKAAQTPMVMICAGSGLAPFRGFIEERALRKQAGEEVAESLLFFGCDAPDVDFIYQEELAAWQAAGLVRVFPAFSAAPQEGVVFVQDRVWKERAEVAAFFKQGAMFYLCGDGRYMAPAVRETLLKIYSEATGADAQAAQAWALEMEKNERRYVTDIFG